MLIGSSIVLIALVVAYSAYTIRFDGREPFEQPPRFRTVSRVLLLLSVSAAVLTAYLAGSRVSVAAALFVLVAAVIVTKAVARRGGNSERDSMQRFYLSIGRVDSAITGDEYVASGPVSEWTLSLEPQDYDTLAQVISKHARTSEAKADRVLRSVYDRARGTPVVTFAAGEF